MKINKVITYSLVAVMAVGTMTACSNSKDVSEETETMEISWMGYPINSSSQEGTLPEQAIEEKFGVDIKPVFLPYGSYNDQKSMMFASDTIPDVIYEMDPANVKQDAYQEILSQVNYDTIKKYAPAVYKDINDNAPTAWLYSRVDDENYGIPNLNYLNSKTKIGLWRMDWLKQVGIDKVPETIDEMYIALKKITSEDPDGNGKNDTYGMSGTIGTWNAMFTDIFGAYGVIPFNWMKDKNGDISYGGFKNGTLEALTTLQQWYSEGLIHPDFILDSPSSTGKEKFVNGIVGYINQLGTYFAPDDKSSIPSVAKSITPTAEIAMSSPVKGPKGKSGTHTWGLPCHIVCFGKQIKDEPKKLQKILDILETLATDEDFMIKTKMGTEGEQWELRDPNGSIADGVNFLAPFDDATQRSNECLNDTFSGPTFFMPISPIHDTYKKYSSKNLENVYNQYCSNVTAYTDAFMKPDVLPSAQSCFEDIRTAQIDLMVKAIKGDITVEQYKKSFTKTWEKLGGKQLEKEASEMKNEISSIYKEVGVK